MSPWLFASGVTMLALVPCAATALRRDAMRRLVGLEMTSVVVSLLMMLLAQGFARSFFFDLALALALLSLGGGLVFARFLERWL